MLYILCASTLHLQHSIPTVKQCFFTPPTSFGLSFWPSSWSSLLFFWCVQFVCQCVWWQFADMIETVIIIKILRYLKSDKTDFKDLNISILFCSIVYGKVSSGSIQYRNFLVSWKPVSFLAITVCTEVDTWIHRNRQQWETTCSVPITCG